MECSVNYILIDTATMERQSFQGWPDFYLTDKCMGAGVMLVSMGEIESKGDCLFQLAIYATGQFKNNEKEKNSIESLLTLPSLSISCRNGYSTLPQNSLVNTIIR